MALLDVVTLPGRIGLVATRVKLAPGELTGRLALSRRRAVVEA